MEYNQKQVTQVVDVLLLMNPILCNSKNLEANLKVYLKSNTKPKHLDFLRFSDKSCKHNNVYNGLKTHEKCHLNNVLLQKNGNNELFFK